MATGTLRIQRAGIPWDGEDEDGLLVFRGEVSAAVLVRLDASVREEDQGRRHLEAGLGPGAVRQATFDMLQRALRRIADRAGHDPDDAIAPALADERRRPRPE